MAGSFFSEAVVFEQPGSLSLRAVQLCEPLATDLVVDVVASGISTGTEKLLWEGTMPMFPGLGYPLVPGYEAVGRVAHSGQDCSIAEGTQVFVPGASCYEGEVRGLFGASASRLIVPEARVTCIPDMNAEQGVILALAATAMHILSYRWQQRADKDEVPHLADLVSEAPQLIIGHGVLGRLLARMCVAIGAQAPVVWELDNQRRSGAQGYEVIAPADCTRSTRQHIADVSGATGEHFNDLISLLGKGGRLTLGGFYQAPVNFNFAPAFIREATIGIASEWTPADLNLVMRLVSAGALSLDGLVTHQYPKEKASEAYPMAFTDSACLKTILNWSA
ncbi:MAG: chlorophyll synthesis pathway protein BchC [Granulosicoccus sp.]